MKEYLKLHLHIASYLAIIAGAIVLGVWYADIRHEKLENILETKLNLKEKNLASLSELTDRNGADEVTERVITDCPRRNEYESMLTQLSTLTKKELVEIQSLSESCGDFFAERKALMVSRLERELESLYELSELRGVLDAPEYTISQRLETWKQLVELEKSRSTLLTEQNSLQEQIITLLISGSTPYTKDVTSLVSEAREIEELLQVQNSQIDELRKSLSE